MLTTKDIYANDNIFDDESWKEDSYKDEKKQTLHRLLDKYHNDPDEVERLSTIAEDIDFKFSRQYLNEVLRERAAGRLSLSAQPAEMRLSAAPERRYAANAKNNTAVLNGSVRVIQLCAHRSHITSLCIHQHFLDPVRRNYLRIIIQ